MRNYSYRINKKTVFRTVLDILACLVTMFYQLLGSLLAVLIVQKHIFPPLFYGCKPCPLILREEHGLGGFENRLLMGPFGPQRNNKLESGEEFMCCKMIIYIRCVWRKKFSGKFDKKHDADERYHYLMHLYRNKMHVATSSLYKLEYAYSWMTETSIKRSLHYFHFYFNNQFTSLLQQFHPPVHLKAETFPWNITYLNHDTCKRCTHLWPLLSYYSTCNTFR